MPLLARMPTRMPWIDGEAGDQRLAVERLELGKIRAVDEPRDDAARIVLAAEIDRHDRLQIALRRRAARSTRRSGIEGAGAGPRFFTIWRTIAKRVPVVERVMIGDAGAARMHLGAAELLGRHHLAGRGFHQRRAAEKDRPLPLHDHRLVRHRRHIGAARRARAHDAGDLRDAGGRQCAPGCRRCGRNARGRETPRSGAAGWRRRNRPDRCRAAGSRARSPARGDASSPSSDSRCRPSPWRRCRPP